MKKNIEMVTVLAKQDCEVNGRKFYKGTTYTLTASNYERAKKEAPEAISRMDRSGPVRRDKEIHTFQTN